MPGRGLLVALAIAGLSLVAPVVHGQVMIASPSKPPPPKVTVPPKVLSVPPNSDMLRFYPKKAWDEGIEARTAVRCSLSAEAVLSDCVVFWDTTPGQGFDTASMQLAQLIRFRPKTVNGLGVPSKVNIPLYWSAPRMDFASPNQSKLMAAYPAAALAANRDGHATIECLLVAKHLTACQVVEEGDPADGFGAAALALAPRFGLFSCVRQRRNQPLVQEPVRVSFYWFAARTDPVSAGPAKAIVGYSNRFTSVITGALVDPATC